MAIGEHGDDSVPTVRGYGALEPHHLIRPPVNVAAPGDRPPVQRRVGHPVGPHARPEVPLGWQAEGASVNDRGCPTGVHGVHPFAKARRRSHVASNVRTLSVLSSNHATWTATASSGVG